MYLTPNFQLKSVFHNPVIVGVMHLSEYRGIEMKKAFVLGASGATGQLLVEIRRVLRSRKSEVDVF